ncbi:MAG TPA: PIN domain-containing protein [Verrucomicrobiae bacterium]|nr:PIN domain-containing protein [Verrucomicrobiae bacterium]
MDTWGWLAYGHRRDSHHPEIKALFEALLENRTPIHTTDYILDELITLLFRRESYSEATQFLDGLMSDSARGRVQIQKVNAERFQAALDLRKRYQDKPNISFTDLTTMAIMRELGIASIITEDDHFLQVGLGFRRIPS